MPVTRTSLAGDAVDASVNRCRASRAGCATPSSTARSTAGRHVEVITVGTANTAISSSAGCTDASRAIVTASRRIQPSVENTDMYM
jgi:hypothetical protein